MKSWNNFFQGVEISLPKTLLKLSRFSKWPPQQAVKEDVQCTSKYGQLRISLAMDGHMLNNKLNYLQGGGMFCSSPIKLPL